MSKFLTNHEIDILKINKKYPKSTKARIVPYKIINNQCYFLLCEENFKIRQNIGKYNMLGGAKNENETILKCAERELFEETLGLINFKPTNIVLKRNKRYIYFIPYYGTSFIQNEFKKRLKIIKEKQFKQLPENLKKIDLMDSSYYEINSLSWVHESDINNHTIYKSVKDIFVNILSIDSKKINYNDFIFKLKNQYLKNQTALNTSIISSYIEKYSN